jgi:penicillin-binding protein 2
MLHSYQKQAMQSPEKTQFFRLNMMLGFLIICAFILVFRLAYLQISQYKRFQTLSLKNQMSIIPIEPTRGIIVDRNGVLLAENVAVYALEITPERVKNLKLTLSQLQEMIPSISEDDIEQFYRLKKQNRAFTPLPLKIKLSEEEVARFAVNQYRFPGVNISAQLMRHYPLGEISAHIIGHVGRINMQELQQLDSANYRATNFVGKSGIERYYEDSLHGQVGYKEVETDVSGRVLRTLSKENPKSGKKLVLSIDARIQTAAHEAMKQHRGAVVMVDVNNGEILAMVSAPSFDPNLFVSGISSQDYKKLIYAKSKPMYNRAILGLYAPASTLKPFIALAGLENNAIKPSTSIYDPGSFKLANSSHIYRDWKKYGHGMVNLKRAITISCDTYFYRLGNVLGISMIEDMLTKFGYGQSTQVDMPGEASGVVPSAAWKKQKKGLAWYPGDTLITAIGQGFMLATPLQLAQATAAIGMHGKRFRPHFLKEVIDGDNNKYQKKQRIEEYPVHLSNNEYWDIMADAMKNVILSREGTGFRFGRTNSYDVAAKTGTAQVYSGKLYEKVKYQDIPELLRDNSLFIAYAPIKNPKIAIAVIIENDYIAPNIARKVMDAYFERNQAETDE